MKTAVITGASRGIGLATTKLFLENGWRVIGTYHANKIPLNSENLYPIQVDFAKQESVAKATTEIKKINTDLDVLVNCAGICPDGKDTTIDITKIRETFEVNLFAVIDFTNKLLSSMKKGSHIVNIDSNYGAFSFPIDDETHTGYRLSKAALNMFTRILAFNERGHGVIVSSLDPGWVKTNMGMIGATETEKPDREPGEVAKEIYHMGTEVSETGYFWRFNKKRDW